MDRCATCGARLRPGLDWCWQCYTPLKPVAPPERVSTSQAVDDTSPQETLARLLLGTKVEEMPMELLRGSADPAPFGVRARRVTTGVVVAFAIATDLLLLPNLKLVAFYAVFAGALSAYVLRRLWSPRLTH
jgi:hypothetical protein